jgi:hypothetical protein
MYNPYGGFGGRDPRFGGGFGGGTFRPGHGTFHMPGSRRDEPPRQPSRSDAPPQQSTQPKVVPPGDPHYYGTRLDCAGSRVISPLCKCNNPAGHGTAWAFEGPRYDRPDIHGRVISWKELANRALAHYAPSTEITREQEFQAYRYILHPQCYAFEMNHYEDINRVIGRGGHIRIDPYDGAGLQFYNADGHVQNHVTEGGLRTTLDRPGSGGGRSHGDSRGPSSGYERRR